MRTLLPLSILATAAVLILPAPAGAADPSAPQVELVHPADGEGFYQGQRVQAAYGCFPGTLGWPVISCEGDLPLGEFLATDSVGTHTFTVHAVDYLGAETTVTHTYTVFDTIPPAATIATPAAGAEYPVGAQLQASTPATMARAVRRSSAASAPIRTVTRFRPTRQEPSASPSMPTTPRSTTAAPR